MQISQIAKTGFLWFSIIHSALLVCNCTCVVSSHFASLLLPSSLQFQIFKVTFILGFTYSEHYLYFSLPIFDPILITLLDEYRAYMRFWVGVQLSHLPPFEVGGTFLLGCLRFFSTSFVGSGTRLLSGIHLCLHLWPRWHAHTS